MSTDPQGPRGGGGWLYLCSSTTMAEGRESGSMGDGGEERELAPISPTESFRRNHHCQRSQSTNGSVENKKRGGGGNAMLKEGEKEGMEAR